jgi:hypothetical protein
MPLGVVALVSKKVLNSFLVYNSEKYLCLGGKKLRVTDLFWTCCGFNLIISTESLDLYETVY